MNLERIKTLISFFVRVYGKYKKQIIILSALGFLGGLLEGIGIGALIPLFSFISGGDGIGQDIISKIINKTFLVINLDLNIWNLIGLVTALFIFKAFALYYFLKIRTKIVADYENNLRSDLYSKTLRANWSYLLKHKIGYLENVLMTDVGANVKMFESVATIILDSTNLLMYVFVAFSISAFITVIALALGAITLLIFKPLISRTKAYAHKQLSLNKMVTHYINENVAGLKTVKVMGAEKEVIGVASGFFERMRFLRIQRSMIKYFTSVVTQPISIFFIVTVFIISYLRPPFNFAVFIAIIYLIQKIFIYIDRAQTSLHAISEAVPFLRNIVNFQDELNKNQEIGTGQNKFEFNDNLEFKKVNFSYNSDKHTIKNISFKIKKGEMIGIIGPSGAGKTTIVDLLLRLFEPRTGEILIDNKNISDISLEQWRKNIGYVSQDVFFRNDTIANNIKFFDERVGDLDMEEATKISNIYNFIQKLHTGFDTMAGERGNLFSGGERQRVALARVLARRPKILVLDEATSTLDNESEAFIKTSLEKLRGGLTIIIIAHRLSTVLDVDRIIAIDDGRIIEEGSPKDLLNKTNSYFYKAYNIINDNI
ncbi:MAG: ATP-binding cassette, subfamily C, bacterial [Parcubacteria group bacterium Athens0714_26]|nr:MAG: ATP-binding cassette, subfamily C, bacterial [Parcubacteria group bacterium Athens1014_26]TSD03023.1 MAG: ATP-binding cassette, subfamily C, bacterial [Parcubacteria group bacterium Athens0714_26]